MKCNLFLTFIALCLSVLFGWLAYTIAPDENIGTIAFIVTSVVLAITLVSSMGMKFEYPKISLNVKVLGLAESIGSVLLNLLFAYLGVRLSIYVIINGIMLLCYLSAWYKIINTKNI